MGVHTLRHHGVLSFVTEHPRYVYGGSFFFVVIPCLLFFFVVIPCLLFFFVVIPCLLVRKLLRSLPVTRGR
jgi:hypothetical protein